MLPVRIPEDVREAVRALHPDLKPLVRAAIDQLRGDPGLGKPLRGELAGWRSFRVRRYRIIFRERSGALEIAALGPRRLIYEDTVRRNRHR